MMHGTGNVQASLSAQHGAMNGAALGSQGDAACEIIEVDKLFKVRLLLPASWPADWQRCLAPVPGVPPCQPPALPAASGFDFRLAWSKLWVHAPLQQGSDS